MDKETEYYNEPFHYVNSTENPTENKQSTVIEPGKDLTSRVLIMEETPQTVSEQARQDEGDTVLERPATAIPSSVLVPVDSEVFRNARNDTESLTLLTLQTQTEFRIEALKYYMESCNDREEIDLTSYLNSYQEICKLLETFGTVLRNIIGRDIRNKIALLRRYQAGPKGAFYQTIDSMVTYEKVTKLYQRNPDDNGSKTVLNLHRSLNFVAEFLRKINESNRDQGVGSVAKEVYNETLAGFHPSAYKYFARLAFSSLGSKEQLVANFHDGSMSDDQLEEVINDVVNAATLAYSRCQAVFKRHNFLNLA